MRAKSHMPRKMMFMAAGPNGPHQEIPASPSLPFRVHFGGDTIDVTATDAKTAGARSPPKSSS